MDDALDKLIQTRFNKLPENLQQHIVSLDMPGIVSRGLRGTDAAISDTRPLENELTLVLLGFEPLNRLAQNVSENSTLSPQQADIFVSNVRVDAFSRVEDELEEVWQEEEKKRKEDAELLQQALEGEKSAPATQSPQTPQPPVNKPSPPQPPRPNQTPASMSKLVEEPSEQVEKPKNQQIPDTIHPERADGRLGRPASDPEDGASADGAGGTRPQPRQPEASQEVGEIGDTSGQGPLGPSPRPAGKPTSLGLETPTQSDVSSPPTKQPPELPEPDNNLDKKDGDENLGAVSDMLKKKMSGQSSSAYTGVDPYREPIDENDLNHKK